MVLPHTEQHTKMRKEKMGQEKKNKVATCCLVSFRGACGAVSYRAAYKDEEEDGEA